MQINLTGFLTKTTPEFMSALWELLLDAQDSPGGVPKALVEQKKAEMRNANKKDEKVLEERRRLDDIREKERGQRAAERGTEGSTGRGRGRGMGRLPRDNGWGGRGGGSGGGGVSTLLLTQRLVVNLASNAASPTSSKIT